MKVQPASKNLYILNNLSSKNQKIGFVIFNSKLIMKPFGEISNLEHEGFRRHGNRIVNNRTEPSILTNDTSLLDKTSNKHAAETQKLYVKEFFDHFFEKKSMLEVISQISNAIYVLQTLVTNFQNEKGIISDSKLHFQTKAILNGSFPNVIQKEGNQISEVVEDLYQRLQGIFQQFKNQQKQIQASPKSFRACESNGDEQLYEMLNDYKNDNKKQKQLKKKAENQCIQLRRQLAKMQDEKIKINQLYKQCEFQVSSLNKKKIELESKLNELNQQINTHINQKDQLSQKLTLLFQINENLSTIEKENEQLKVKLKKSEEKEVQLTKKFENLDDVVKKRIKQKDDKWKALIQEKLTSKTLFENATCSSFRQFMGSMQTLNKC